LGFVRAFALIPFHRPRPRRSPSRGVATTSDSSSKLESRSDLVVSHDLVGLLRRFARVLTWLLVTIHGDEGLASLLHLAANRRVRCVSSADSGGASPGSFVIADDVPCWSRGSRFPASKFIPPGGSPPPAAVVRLRTRCLLGLFMHRRSATVPFGSVSSSARCCRIDGMWSLEALLRWRVRTIEHLIRLFVGLPSLGLVPLRGCLHVGSCVPTELR
jgi:hypothetical protein